MKYSSIVRELLMKRFTCIISLIISFFFIFPVQTVYAQFETRTHTAYTRTIDYLLFTPENYSTEESYPLILVLHGHGGGSNPSAIGLQTWIQDETQQQHPSFVVFPYCPDIAVWDHVLDIVNHLLVSLIDEFSIDTRRLYITGYSMGGFGTSYMIQTSPLHFAAAISVAGGSHHKGIWPLTSYIPPIWNFHGVNDATVNVERSRDMIQAIENVLDTEALYPVLKEGIPTSLTEEQLDSALQAGCPLIYSETYDDHSSIDDNTAYNDPRVKEWMFSHQTDFELPQDPPIQTTDSMSILEHVGTDPVLIHGSPDSWEAFAVSEPCVIMDNDTLKMWYVGWTSVWRTPTHIGYAWSLDGINWNRNVNNPVMSADLPWEGVRINQISVIKENNTFRMWYSAGDNENFSTAIGYAWSEDGLVWTKHEEPVLLPGTIEEWDHFNIAVGTVIKEESIYKMWYHGGTFYTGMKIGCATSSDGIDWAKYDDPQTEDSPYHISDLVVSTGRFVKDWDFHGVWYPIVYRDSHGYRMWYFGSTTGIAGFPHYAVSPDGISWLKSLSNPVLTDPPVWADKTGYFGGSVLNYNGTYHLWYSHYDYETGVSSIGYAVEISKIAHTDSFTISHSFRRAALDTLNITAWVKNPHGDNLEVNARFFNKDSLVDYLPLSNVGNSVWSGQWPVAEGERIYQVGIQTIDIDSGTVHNSVEAISKHFTTIGPIVFDHFEIISSDTIPNAGDHITIKMFLRNDGSVETASNITAKLTSLDPGVTVGTRPYVDYVEYGDIGAGEINESARYFRISFYGPFDKNVYQVPFTLDIRSDDYSYWIDVTGDTTFSIIVGIEQQKGKQIPKEFSLYQNYPNPFNPSTSIEFDLPKTSEVTLNIFNILGEEVATLISGRLSAGSYSYDWDASGFASGVYLYHLTAGDFIATKKLILLK
jgi:predicted GH43/DUF377 family glycosyl hydrolase/dienelactone hydrolase